MGAKEAQFPPRLEYMVQMVEIGIQKMCMPP